MHDKKTSNEFVVTFEWHSFDLRQGYAKFRTLTKRIVESVSISKILIYVNSDINLFFIQIEYLLYGTETPLKNFVIAMGLVLYLQKLHNWDERQGHIFHLLHVVYDNNPFYNSYLLFSLDE